jgi:hypothetical protein
LGTPARSSIKVMNLSDWKHLHAADENDIMSFSSVFQRMPKPNAVLDKMDACNQGKTHA